MGLLPLENLTNEISTTTGVEQNKAQQIYNELTRLVFYSVKDSLQEIYSLKTTGQKVEKTKTPNAQPKEETTPLPAQKTQPATPDTYREPVE